MSRKILILLVLFIVASCGFFIDRSNDYISLELLTKLNSEQRSLIALEISGRNYPDSGGSYPNDPVYGRCKKQSDFTFTFYTPRKRPDSRQVDPALEKFLIKKEDLVLIHQKNELIPSKLYQGQWQFNFIRSTIFAYSDYSKHSSQFATFALPCTKLLDPGTKLVIKKIYKDDKVIKENIEFGFVKSATNKAYSIWLE